VTLTEGAGCRGPVKARILRTLGRQIPPVKSQEVSGAKKYGVHLRTDARQKGPHCGLFQGGSTKSVNEKTVEPGKGKGASRVDRGSKSRAGVKKYTESALGKKKIVLTARHF